MKKEDILFIFFCLAVGVIATCFIIASNNTNESSAPLKDVFVEELITEDAYASDNPDDYFCNAIWYESPTCNKRVIASWYDYTLKDCNDCIWSKNHATAASRTLPRYSTARVTRVDTGDYIDVYINDWIEHPEREIDLSSYAFNQLAPLHLGLIEVTIQSL